MKWASAVFASAVLQNEALRTQTVQTPCLPSRTPGLVSPQAPLLPPEGLRGHQSPQGRFQEHQLCAGIGPSPEWFRMTRDQLQACSKKTLADKARQLGIAGWHGM